MSYGKQSEWCTIVLPPRDKLYEQIKCPGCGIVYVDDFKEQLEECMEAYYTPPHVPQFVSFVCTNINCSDVDEEIRVKLSLIIRIDSVTLGAV